MMKKEPHRRNGTSCGKPAQTDPGGKEDGGTDGQDEDGRGHMGLQQQKARDDDQDHPVGHQFQEADPVEKIQYAPF